MNGVPLVYMEGRKEFMANIFGDYHREERLGKHHKIKVLGLAKEKNWPSINLHNVLNVFVP
jgi:hypothetical protein